MALIKTQEYGSDVDILIAPELAFALPVTITNTGVSAGPDGKKMILAGTPLYASADPLMNRTTKLSVSGTTCYGFARHDVDVTDGDVNDTLLVDGYVDYLKLDDSVQGKIDSLSSTSINARVRFIKGRAQ